MMRARENDDDNDRPPAKRAKGGSAQANRVGSTLEVTRTVPNGYCSRLAHPFTKEHQDKASQDVKTVMELQIPGSRYPGRSAHGIVNMTCDHHDSTVKTIQAIRLFGYLANKVTALRTKTTKGDDGVVIQEDIPSPSTVTVTWECVPSAHDASNYVAYRLRIVEHSKVPGGIIAELMHLIKDNDKDAQKKMKSDATKPTCPTLLSHLTSAAWRKLCMFFQPRILDDRTHTDAKSMDLSDPHCIWNPENVFEIESNLDKARNLNADPRFCDLETYRSYNMDNRHIQYGFPSPEHVYRIGEDSLAPQTLNECILPHIRPDPRAHGPALQDYKKMHGFTEAEALSRWEATSCHTSNSELANDIHKLERTIKDEDAELRAKHRVRQVDHADAQTHAYYAQKHAKQCGDWMSSFRSIVSPSGDCPPALQSISLAMQTYLAENDGVMTIRRDQSTNRTRFQDQMIEWATVFGSVMTAVSAHQDCVLFMLSSLHVYARVPMGVHQLQLGPAGIGKSFALLLMIKLLIEGTFRLLSYITPKAFAIPGKANACQILVLEDAPSSTLGATGGSGSKNAATSDTENIFKQFLTSTTITVQSLVLDPARKADVVTAETACVVFAAMNDSSSKFPFPILDRFCVTIAAQSDNSNKSTDDAMTANMLMLTQRFNEESVKLALAELKLSWHHRQMLMANILYMESCGLLPPIDLGVADTIFMRVAQRARLRSVDMETRQRNVERYRMIVRALVVVHAIDLLWSAPDSPIMGKVHSDMHFLLAQKYMYATQEIAIFALGLVARQWQDTMRGDMLTAMKRHWFPRADALIRESSHSLSYHEAYPNGKQRVLDAKAPSMLPRSNNSHDSHDHTNYDSQDYERKFWMYAKCTFGENGLPPMPSTGRAVPSPSDVLLFMANKLIPHMERKYLPAEVAAKLAEMTQDTVTVTRTLEFEGEDMPEIETEVRPQLVVEHDHFRLALVTMQHAAEGDVIFKAVEDVVTVIHETNPCEDNQSFLYGETENTIGARDVWRIARAGSVAERRLDLDQMQRVYSASYTDAATKTITQNALKHINPVYADERGMRRLFASQTPFVVHDMDMDKYHALKRADALGLSHADQCAAPSNDRRERDKAHRKYYAHGRDPDTGKRFPKPLAYPECFLRRDVAKHKLAIEEEFRKNKKDFMLSHKFKELQKRQAVRPSLYSAGMIGHQEEDAIVRMHDDEEQDLAPY